jgi:hypothetical protein
MQPDRGECAIRRRGGYGRARQPAGPYHVFIVLRALHTRYLGMASDRIAEWTNGRFCVLRLNPGMTVMRRELSSI